MTKLVIFDFDGVIVDSAPFFHQRYGEIGLKYNKPYPPRTMDEFRDWYDSAWENNYTNMGFRPEDVETVLRSERKPADYSGIPLFPGFFEAVMKLAAEYTLAIASCTREFRIREKLEQVHLLQYFSFISGGEAGISDKRDIIGTVLQNLHIKPEQSLMVGDTVMDILSARAHGIPCIAVTYGWNAEKRLQEANPAALVSSPSELYGAVETLFRSR